MTSWARSSASSALGVAVAVALGLGAGGARGNGRMPGATALAIGAAGEERLVLRTTFGLVATSDGGRTFRWICEQAIGVSGEADPPLAVTGDGTWLLVSPKGGLLVSRDDGCTWSPGPALFEGRKTIDLAADPSNASRVVVVSSTVESIDAVGLVTYSNVVGDTKDDGRTFEALGPVPSDLTIDTIEVAPSDPTRLYLSGTASADPLEGVVLRSEDSGATWLRGTLTLPSGSGSVFVGAVDPRNPDRLWIRVPARGDVFGFFPAELLVSEDAGQHFTRVAGTERAMFGLALSPDGTQLAYGGPFDGLFVGPSSGGPFTKVSDLGVRCLKWREKGLYACASEPTEPFTLGLSAASDGVFDPLYATRDTCPQACGSGGAFGDACDAPWTRIGPAIGAGACGVTVPDAGTSSGGATGAAGAPQGGGGGAPGGGGAATGAGGAAGTGAASDGGPSSEAGVDGGRATDADADRAGAPDCACRLGAAGRPAPTGLTAAFLAFALRRRSRIVRRARAAG